MAPLKVDMVKRIVFSLPVAFLAAGLLGLPLPVPAFLFPERSYVVADGPSFASGDAARLLEKHPKALGMGFGGIAPFPSLVASPPGTAFLPGLLPVLEHAKRNARPWERISIVTTLLPTEQELSRMADFERTTGMSISCVTETSSAPKPVLALSYRISSGQKTTRISVAFGPDADAWDEVAVGQEGGTAVGSKVDELPADRSLSFPFDLSGLPSVSIEARGGKAPYRIGIPVPVGRLDDPRVLVISERKGISGFIDSAWPTRRITASGLGTANPSAYELVVVDGGPLASLGEAGDAALRDIVVRGSGSVLFVADSPDFGRPGDAPAVESILPVELLPRTVRKLPDMAILVLVDRSGSMWGEKFSLAKVTGVEFFRNMKPTDLTALALFSDELEWARKFQRNSEGSPGKLLEPAAAGGGTDLHAALSKCLDEIGTVNVEERHVIVVSDGITKPADFPGLAARASREGVTISAVAVGEDMDATTLTALVEGTGGHYYSVKKPDEIPSVVFEDRMRAARTSFAAERTAIFGVDGAQVAWVDAMSRFAPRDSTSVLFADELGDPFFISREFGERACLLLASDQYGTYTKEFFRSESAVSVLKKRLDTLFADRPVDVGVTLHARGATITLRGESLVAPSVTVASPGGESREAEVRSPVNGAFAADIDSSGSFEIVVSDRGGVAARFPLDVAAGLAGRMAPSKESLRERLPRAFIPVRDRRAWIALFFIASLAVTAWSRFVS
ncbi:MAG: VWA domain-containing protein [Spirochaetes bacterium]|nr:VWA domain-containing protein [Spirochaetota bacterium]